MVSIGVMIQRIDDLCGTDDLTNREEAFVENIVRTTDKGKHTALLTEPQVKWLTDIFNRHFAGKSCEDLHAEENSIVTDQASE